MDLRLNRDDLEIKESLNSAPDCSCSVSSPTQRLAAPTRAASEPPAAARSQAQLCPELLYLLQAPSLQRDLQSLLPHFLHASAHMSPPHTKRQNLSPPPYLA